MYKIILFLLLSLNFASSDLQHLICKSVVDGVYSDGQTPELAPNNQVNRGPPGRRGKPGIRGEIGLPGPPGRVTYKRIDEVIDRKIALALVKARKQIHAFMGNGTGTLPGSGCEEGGLVYNRTCYTIRSSKSRNGINYRQGLEECSRNGGSLAEIHDRNHQTAIRNFIHSQFPPNSTVVEIRIGMEYVKWTSTFLYRSGKQMAITELKWWDSGNTYPIGADNSLIYRMIADQGGHEGLRNADSSSHTAGVLCERNI